MLQQPAAYVAPVVVLASLCQWLAWRVRIPSILVLLLVGFALGQGVTPDEVIGRDVLFAGVTLAVGIILFEGSLSLRLRDVRDLGRPVWRLCSVTVALAWSLITTVAWLVGVPLTLALLVGAILVVTGPTVINPILRQLRPTRRVSSLLRWEGIVVDPIGAILAAAVGSLVASDLLQSESGLLTVTMLGIYLGNRPGLHLEHVLEFKEHLQVLFVGALFVVLAGRVTPEQVMAIAPQAAVFVAALVLVVRPVSVQLALLGTRTTRQERLLLSFMAPRGIVAAAVTAIFALELEHAAQVANGGQAQRLEGLAQEAQALVPLVFLTIVATVAIYGLGVGRLAERLGLATSTPQGVVFAGAAPWVRETAGVLAELEVPTVLVSQEPGELSRSRMDGLRVERSHILSEYAVEEMDLAGIASFVAATTDDETNATAARELAHDLGRSNVFQLQRQETAEQLAAGEKATSNRRTTAERLSARTPFDPAQSYEQLQQRSDRGMQVRRTRLTEQFTLEDFRARHPDAVLLFTHEDGVLRVVTEETEVPERDVTLVALVEPR